MKIKNLEMVAFLNKADEIQKKRLPIKLHYALKLNRESLFAKAQIYMQEYNRLKKEGKEKELNELILSDTEAEVQKVKFSDLAKMDDSENYDALTGEEFAIIDFMIAKE